MYGYINWVEVVTEDRVRSRATSYSHDQGNVGEDESHSDILADPGSRTVEVVRQTDQASLSIRKTTMPDQLVR